MSSKIPLTQAMVDARWQEIGGPQPAPLIPPGYAGLYPNGTKTGIMWTDAFGKIPKHTKAEGKAFRDFWNYFSKVAIDPYRKQSGISKVAGGILQVASVAIPVFSTIQAVTEAGNAGLALSNAKSDEKLVERVMTPAIDAAMAKEAETAAALNAAKDAELAAQIKALTAPVPVSNSVSTLTPIPLTSPSSSAAQIQIPVFSTSPKPATVAPKKYFGFSETEAAVLAAGLLGVLLWSRR